MLTIYTPHITNRLTYICDFIFENLLGCHFQFVDSQDDAQIVYAENQPSKNQFWIPATDLLFQTDVKNFKVEIGKWNDLPTLFPIQNDCAENNLPFDLFAASFYLLSRYEEYQIKTKDQYGRFPANESVAYKNHFLEIPLIDCWTKRLKEKLLKWNSSLEFHPHSYTFIPTIDVDSTFAYRNRGVLQTLACCVRDVVKGKCELAKNRLLTVLRLKQDPFFNLEEVDEMHRKIGLQPLFFFHCGWFGKHDKRAIYPSWRYDAVRKKISRSEVVGMHPSYNSAKCYFLFKMEKMMMKWNDNSARPIRFHYLRMTVPETYEQLEADGFTSDWSMCYSNDPGFRASTSHPFKFFNLWKNEVSNLTVYPTAVMDKTLKQNLKLNLEESLQYILRLRDVVKSVDGTFITLFHNEHFAEDFGWKGWKEMYERMLAECQSR